MISDYLDREFVITQTTAQRDWLAALQKRVRKQDKAALADLRKHKIKPAQLDAAVVALNKTLKTLAKDTHHPQGTPFIPSDPLACALQTEMSRAAVVNGGVEKNLPKAKKTATRKAAGKTALDTSATHRLETDKEGLERAAFVEGSPFADGDIHYGLDGFFAKFGAVFTGPRAFNKKPARTAASDKSLRLFLFGDWGTGLPLAAEVTKRVREQLDSANPAKRRQHVIHLGDVYYTGKPDEYVERVLPFWPVASGERKTTGSWSLNGNHDMYAGGYGYFDTLLTEERFSQWHSDEKGKPSSFFLIEDADWQVYGLDTSWNLPSVGSVMFGKPTKEDLGGQNGILTDEQVKWMAKTRNTAKGCLLLTHHQPASSRSTEKQHADLAVAALKEAGLYDQIDAWIWGHEHRGVVFKPKKDRVSKVLKAAPDFCACMGHGGVPVTAKNFEAENRIADVLWDEDRLGPDSPLYEGERVIPFGFARVDSAPGSLDFRVFDHTGAERFKTTITKTTQP